MAVGEPDYTLPCSTQRGGSIAWSTQRWRRAGGYNVNVNVNVNTEEVRKATGGYNVNFSVGLHGRTYRLGSLPYIQAGLPGEYCNLVVAESSQV